MPRRSPGNGRALSARFYGFEWLRLSRTTVCPAAVWCASYGCEALVFGLAGWGAKAKLHPETSPGPPSDSSDTSNPLSLSISRSRIPCLVLVPAAPRIKLATTAAVVAYQKLGKNLSHAHAAQPSKNSPSLMTTQDLQGLLAYLNQNKKSKAQSRMQRQPPFTRCRGAATPGPNQRPASAAANIQ